MKKLVLATLLTATFAILPTQAADYVIDYKGAHASINFKVKHLGYSWLTGRFNTFDGKFSYDEANVSASKITVNIDTASVDTNHAERNKHLRGDKFLEVSDFASARFVSSKVEDLGNNKLKITGLLSLHGVNKEIVIDAEKIGEGKDPWGGYRAGFSGTTSINMKDFGFGKDFGQIDFDLHLEGIKQ
ncbi:MAG: YceI family protein [Thalassotalea sp.]